VRAVDLSPGDVDALARDVAARGGGLRLRARLLGTSMAPAIRSGDRLEVEAIDPGHLRSGDVAVYRGGHGRLVAHRVVRAAGEGNPDWIVTRADAPGAGDEIVAEQALLGRVRTVRRGSLLRRLVRRVLLGLRPPLFR